MASTQTVATDATSDRSSEKLYSTRTERETEQIDGGEIVWDVELEKRKSGWTPIGKQLVELQVDDSEAVRAELIRRGIGVGALYHATTESDT